MCFEYGLLAVSSIVDKTQSSCKGQLWKPWGATKQIHEHYAYSNKWHHLLNTKNSANYLLPWFSTTRYIIIHLKPILALHSMRRYSSFVHFLNVREILFPSYAKTEPGIQTFFFFFFLGYIILFLPTSLHQCFRLLIWQFTEERTIRDNSGLIELETYEC